MASRVQSMLSRFEASRSDSGSSVTRGARKVLESILKTIWKRQRKLRILVTGKTGQGKSTLINGILGTQIAKEGAGARRVTKKVERFAKTIKGVPIRVYDSPGLQDRMANEDKYIEGMVETCKELSLVLYCTKMGNTRLTDDDKNAMTKLTRAFGEKFWNYAVFVLTFANCEDVSRKDDRDANEPEPDAKDEKGWKDLEARRFQGRLKLWKEELQRFLIDDVGVSAKIAQEIPVIPTGDHKVSRRNPQPFVLPDRDDWFTDFWEACCRRVKDTYLFLQVNSHRMVPEFVEDEVNSEDGSTTAEEKNIVEELEELLKSGYATSRRQIFEQNQATHKPDLRRHSTFSGQVCQPQSDPSKRRFSNPTEVISAHQKSQMLPARPVPRKKLQNEKDLGLPALPKGALTPQVPGSHPYKPKSSILHTSPISLTESPMASSQTHEQPLTQESSAFQTHELPKSSQPLSTTQEWPTSVSQMHDLPEFSQPSATTQEWLASVSQTHKLLESFQPVPTTQELPTSVSYLPISSQPMPITQECPAYVSDLPESSQPVPTQEWPTSVSDLPISSQPMPITQECPAYVSDLPESSQPVPTTQEWPTSVSDLPISSQCPTYVSDLPESSQLVATTQEWPASVSQLPQSSQSVPTTSAQENPGSVSQTCEWPKSSQPPSTLPHDWLGPSQRIHHCSAPHSQLAFTLPQTQQLSQTHEWPASSKPVSQTPVPFQPVYTLSQTHEWPKSSPSLSSHEWPESIQPVPTFLLTHELPAPFQPAVSQTHDWLACAPSQPTVHVSQMPTPSQPTVSSAPVSQTHEWPMCTPSQPVSQTLPTPQPAVSAPFHTILQKHEWTSSSLDASCQPLQPTLEWPEPLATYPQAHEWPVSFEWTNSSQTPSTLALPPIIEWPLPPSMLLQTEEWQSLPQLPLAKSPTASSSASSSPSLPASSPSTPPEPDSSSLADRKAPIRADFVRQLTVEAVEKQYGEEAADAASSALKTIRNTSKWFVNIFK